MVPVVFRLRVPPTEDNGRTLRNLPVVPREGEAVELDGSAYIVHSVGYEIQDHKMTAHVLLR